MDSSRVAVISGESMMLSCTSPSPSEPKGRFPDRSLASCHMRPLPDTGSCSNFLGTIKDLAVCCLGDFSTSQSRPICGRQG
eukprot:16448588-Heterocapsa_arctica.AAC.1